MVKPTKSTSTAISRRPGLSSSAQVQSSPTPRWRSSPAEECRVFIRDHHAGYMEWATYEENQRMIRRNCVTWEGDESMAAIRAGQGLLVGLLRCGHCGRKLHVRYWGGRGTNARYLCKGDYDGGGQYCIGFGGSSVDRRVGQELLKAIAPLGVEASLRNLEEIEAVKQQLSSLDAQRYSLSPEEEIRIRSMGDHFAEVWQSGHCPPTRKKMIFRTAIEDIIVRSDQDKKTLELVIHWKGGVHTQLAMGRPRSATETGTPVEALEIIRRMAVCYGDDQIASVLNRRGYSTGKGSDGIRRAWRQPGATIPLPVKDELCLIRRELA